MLPRFRECEQCTEWAVSNSQWPRYAASVRIWTANGLLCSTLWIGETSKLHENHGTRNQHSECNYSTVLHHFYLFIFFASLQPTSECTNKCEKKNFCNIFIILLFVRMFGCWRRIWNIKLFAYSVQKRAFPAAAENLYQNGGYHINAKIENVWAKLARPRGMV